MAIPLTGYSDSDQRKQLGSFLLWLIGITAVAGVGNIALWLLLSQPIILLLLGVDAGCAVGLGLALLLLRRVGIVAGVVVAGVTLMLAVAFVAVAAPTFLPVMVLIPPLLVAAFLPYLDSRAVLRMIGGALIFELLLVLLPHLILVELSMPDEVETILVPLMLPFVCAALLAMLWQFHRQLTSLLGQAKQANAALKQAQISLEDQVSARTAELSSALGEIEARAAQQSRLLEEVEQQREAIRELSVPMLPVAHDTFVLPLVGALDSARISQFHAQTLSTLERTRTRQLLIDVTGVLVIDTLVAKGIIQTIQAARLLGTESALVGIRPEVAQTIVGLGIDLSAIHTFPDLETALAR
jgi:rsbT co-antagonist protein RsbR